MMTNEMKTTYKQNNIVIAKLQKLEEDFLENKDFEEDYEVFVQDVNALLDGTDDPELIENVELHVAKMETCVEDFHKKIRSDRLELNPRNLKIFLTAMIRNFKSVRILSRVSFAMK